MFEKCNIHGEECEVILVCRHCCRPMNEEFHEQQHKHDMTLYYDLKKKVEEKSQ